MKKMIRPVLGVALLLAAVALGYVGYAQWILPPAEEQPEIAEAEDRQETGPLLEIPELVTDLQPSEEGHSRYVSLRVALECLDARAVESVEGDLARIQDALLEVLRSRTPEELKGDEGMTALRREILLRINQIVGTDRVANVYFTRLMVQ